MRVRLLTWLALWLCLPASAAADEKRGAWVEADIRLGKEGVESALRFARQVETPDADALLRFLGGDPSPERVNREALGSALELPLPRDPRRGHQILRDLDVSVPTILAARIWQARAAVHTLLGEPRQALAAADAYAETARELGWLRGEAEAHRFRARVLQGSFEYAALVPLYARLAEIETLRGETRAAAAARLNHGGALTEVGRTRQAIAILEKLLPGGEWAASPSLLAAVHQGLALARHRVAEYAEALDHLDRVETHRPPDSQGSRVQDHSLRGAIYVALGLFSEAANAHREALGDRASMTPIQHADALASLGAVLWREGRAKNALATLEEAHEAFLHLGDGVRSAMVRREVGRVLASLGEIDAALTTLRNAMAGLDTHPVQRVETLACLAEAHLMAHDLKSAQAAIDMALAQPDAEEDRQTQIRLRELTGRLHLARGRPESALEALRGAMDLVDDVSGGLSDEETFRAREQRALVFALAVFAAFETGEVAAAFDTVERGRAVALLDALGTRNAVRKARLPPRLMEEIRLAEDAFQVAQTNLTDARRAGVRARVTETRAERDAADRRLREASARGERTLRRTVGATPGKTSTPEALRSRLGPDEAFVHIAVAEGALRALVSTADAARLVELGDAAPVEAGVRRVLEGAEGDPEGDPRVRAALEDLRRALIAPLRLPETIRTVLVSPDGALSHAPWPALLPSRCVACVPSSATWRLLLPERSKRGRGILAFGDPDYGGGGTASLARGAARDWRLTPLPATRDEVLAISKIEGASRHNRAFLGGRATETAFRRAVGSSPRWRSIHFACHGLIDRARPRLSALALTRDAENDGLLTSPEVFGTSFHADLVVLSACASGRDRFVRAEGVAGLLRAFLVAGAPRLLVSLWKVDDGATKELMIHLYERWLRDGLTPTEALRAAQRHVASRERWRHPRYWAAWVLWGLAD